MLIAVVGIATVAGLVAFFLMKEKELDRRLQVHFGWTKYDNGATALFNRQTLFTFAICLLLSLMRIQRVA